MDQVKSFIAIALLGAVTFSCDSNGKFSDEIETVDSLIVLVETYQRNLDSASVDTVNEKLAMVTENMDYLVENYRDSNDRKFWITNMNYMRQVKKAYGRYGEQKQPLSRQMEESLKQLHTLRNSLEDQKLTEEEAEKYVQDEAEVVFQLGFNTRKVNEGLKWGDEVWDSLRPYFDSITVYYRSQEVQ